MLMLLSMTYVFFIGAISGSFLVATINSILQHKSNLGRSTCWNCNHVLNALDLIPIIGYIVRGGKCRYCSRKIPVKYPIYEAIFGLVATLFLVSNKVATILYVLTGILTTITEFISYRKEVTHNDSKRNSG